MSWYNRVTSDLSTIPDFIAHYESLLIQAKKDVRISGNVEKSIASLPGITEQHFHDLQTVEAVLKYLELQLRKIRTQYFRKYLEAYNRQLTSRDADRYVEGEEEVIDFESILNSVALIRNQYLGIIKALEQKSFGMGHIVRLRTAGMENISMD
jgi:hypothetical protein